MFWNKYPYSNLHDLNLDWIIAKLKEIESDLAFVIDNASLKYADPIAWSITHQYQANTVVIDPETGIAYLSTKPVPTNILITDTNYWTPIFDLSSLFSNLETDIANEAIAREEADDVLRASITALENEMHVPAYINVKDYGVESDTDSDQYAAIQQVIDDHPNATIFIPDGTYLISQALKVYGNTARTVFLKLAKRAVLKASETNTDYLVEIGTGGDTGNSNVWINGGLSGISGGCLDTDGRSGGIHIVTGIQAPNVTDVTIINLRKTGIKMEYGINSGSLDALISNVKILGKHQYASDSESTIGIDCAAYDNTFRDVFIMGVWTGVNLTGAGNSLFNVHPVFAFSDVGNYVRSRAFDVTGQQRFESCYADSFGRGFWFRDDNKSVLNNTIVHWYNNAGFIRQFPLWADGELSITGNNMQINFATVQDAQYSGLILANSSRGCVHGFIENVMINDPSKITLGDDPIYSLMSGHISTGSINGMEYKFYRLGKNTIGVYLRGTPSASGEFSLTKYPPYITLPAFNTASGHISDINNVTQSCCIKWFPGDTNVPQLNCPSTALTHYIVGTSTFAI